MDDFRKYEEMRRSGESPPEIYRTARADGLDSITLIRLLRTVCKLSLREAKEVTVVADGLGTSLSDYQEKLLPGVERFSTPQKNNGGVGEAPEAARAEAPGVDDGEVV